MKTPIASLVLMLATAVSLPAAVTISVTNNTPDGGASGGGGIGTGLFSSSQGTPVTDRGMPVTTYTVSGIDLSSEGGTASESFTFTITYSATTDGSTSGTPVFNGFGNVAVLGGNSTQVDGDETLTATVALSSSTFAGLSLTGFTGTVVGGLGAGESGTLTHGGGTTNITSATTQYAISGTSVTYEVTDTSQFNFQGFTAEFEAVPEPGAASLLGLALVSMLRRRRSA